MTPIAQIHPSAGWRSVSIPVVRSVWRRLAVLHQPPHTRFAVECEQLPSAGDASTHTHTHTKRNDDAGTPAWSGFKVEMGSDCYELTLVVEVTIGLVSTTPVEVGADSKSMRGTIRSAT